MEGRRAAHHARAEALARGGLAERVDLGAGGEGGEEGVGAVGKEENGGDGHQCNSLLCCHIFCHCVLRRRPRGSEEECLTTLVVKGSPSQGLLAKWMRGI